MTKKKPKVRYGLSRKHARKSARDFLDMDYLDDPRLTQRDLDFLDKFCREHYQGTFKNTSTDLHRTKAAKRDCYNANNARYRDMWNQFLRAFGDVSDIEDKDDDE